MAIARTHQSIVDAAKKADEELNVLLNDTEKEATPEVTPPSSVVTQENVIENASMEVDKKPETEVEQVKKPVESKKEDDGIWYERWKQINGKYINEVPRFAAEVRDLKKENLRLEEQIRGLTEQSSGVGGKEQAQSQDTGIDGLVDTFGEEGSQKINAYLDKRVKEIKREFENKLKPVETGIESIKTGHADTLRQRYIDGLDRMAPGWRRYSNDQGFGKWLDEKTAKYSGLSLRQILSEADSQMNSATVAEMILDYEKSIVPLESGPTEARQKELEKRLAPAKTGGSGRTLNGNEAETYSKKVIDKFYQDWQSQKLKTSIPDRMKMDEIYTRAIIEGRLTP